MNTVNGWCRIVVAVNSHMRVDVRSCTNVFRTSDSKYYRPQSLRSVTPCFVVGFLVFFTLVWPPSNAHSNWDKKSPQIVGLRPPMCSQFLAGKLYCDSTEDFGAFATTMISKRLSIQSVTPCICTVWP